MGWAFGLDDWAWATPNSHGYSLGPRRTFFPCRRIWPRSRVVEAPLGGGDRGGVPSPDRRRQLGAYHVFHGFTSFGPPPHGSSSPSSSSAAAAAAAAAPSSLSGRASRRRGDDAVPGRGPQAPGAGRARGGLRPPRHRWPPRSHLPRHVASRRRLREPEGGVPRGGATVDRLRGVRHHPPPLLPPHLLVQDHRRPRAARGARRQGAPAQVLPPRHRLQPGVRRGTRPRRGRHPDQARLHQHLDRPLHPRRLRRRPHRYHAPEHRHHSLKMPLHAARQDDADRRGPHARRRPLHQGHHPPLLLRRHAAEAPAPPLRQGPPLQQLHAQLGNLCRLRRRGGPDRVPVQHLRGRRRAPEEDDCVQVHAGEGRRPRGCGGRADQLGRGRLPQRRAALPDQWPWICLQARGLLPAVDHGASVAGAQGHNTALCGMAAGAQAP